VLASWLVDNGVFQHGKETKGKRRKDEHSDPLKWRCKIVNRKKTYLKKQGPNECCIFYPKKSKEAKHDFKR
jgi:hypothetical protein